MRLANKPVRLQDDRSADLYLELLVEVADPQTGNIRVHEGTLHDLVEKVIEVEDQTFEFCTRAYENGASSDEVREQIRRGDHHRTKSGFIRRTNHK